MLSSAGHPAPGIRVEHHDVGARVRQGRDPGQPVDRAHADPVPARQRQLAAHHLGEGLVGLEHDLRRPGPLGVDVARQRQPGATDVGDAQRAGWQGVDDGGEVLDVLEDAQGPGSRRSTCDCGEPSSITVTPPRPSSSGTSSMADTSARLSPARC